MAVLDMLRSILYSFDMDQNPNDFSAKKDAVAKEMVDLMVKSLEAGTLTADDSEKASRFMVEQLDKAQDIYYLKVSVEELVKNWPCFQPLLLSFKTDEAENKDQVEIAAAQEQLEELQKPTN